MLPSNNILAKDTALLQIDGNVWRVSTLGKALLVGMLASIVPIATLFFFNDNRSLGIESEAHGTSETEAQAGKKLSF